VRIEAASAAQLLRPRGVYLITGGYGGIGGVLAESLARAVQARLVLVGRSGLPAREHWPQILAQGKDSSQRQRMAWVERLEQSGAAVLALEADAGDLAQMEEVVRRAEQEFGAIHGIIHAAGVAGGSLLQWRRPEQGHAVLRPKLDGARVMGQLFAARQPDWMVFCSSLSAVLGGIGQVDYCAANAFLDSYAAERQRHTGQRTLAINWDTWQQVGMAVHTPVPKELEAQRRQALERGIHPEEGVEAFARMVCSPLPQIAVSTSPLLPRIEAFRQPSAAPAAQPVSPTPASPGVPAARYPRPALHTPYLAPRNSREKDLAEIWQDMFGMEQIGVEDDFFELGGHSLLAIQLTSRIRSALATNLSPRAIFDHPSVAKLAEHITQTKSSEEERLASVLKSIEDLSDEDLNRLLGRANSHAAND
jgi:NAD(P)-dependent dehydrogenase (short-subunit alcohol dehydrogenase family)/acyl carrier protein